MKTTKLLIFLFSLVAVESLAAQITIMPLGDSITYDNHSGDTRPAGLRTGYRQQLWLDLQAAGYDVDFVGSVVAGQDAFPTFDPDNEGHPGWTDSMVAENIYSWLMATPANIVLLHIGTNALDTKAADVQDILDEVDRYEGDTDTHVKVLLARIINRSGHICPKTSTTTMFNDNVELMALRRSDPGQLGYTGGLYGQPDDIIIVDMECGAELDYAIDTSPPYDHDMYDNLHPNDKGYAKMADKWFTDGLLNILPQADAGTGQSVNERAIVTLDGSWSIDPDAPNGIPLDYSWTQQSGTSVVLSDPTAQKPTFTAPEVGANGDKLGFKLTVTDADGFEHSDTASINVKNVLVPPSADAGSDQNVAAGRTVTLDGSNSLDPDGTFSSLKWKQISGKNQVTLTTPNKLTTEFTAPSVDADGDVLTFELAVTDNDGLSSSDTVTVKVAVPEAPVAKAGADQSVTEGETVTLNGSESYDPDGTISVAQWEQISGKNQVTLTSPKELTSEFKAPAVDSGGDTLTFKLMIIDIDGRESEDSINVTVRPTAVSPANSNSSGSGGGGGCFIQTTMN